MCFIVYGDGQNVDIVTSLNNGERTDIFTEKVLETGFLELKELN